MKREEAIKRLEDYKNVMIESIPSDKMQEALNIAIEALKNQESEKERIIKELEEATEIGANDFGQFECIPKWKAIEILRGGK